MPINLQEEAAGTFVVAIFRAPEIAEVDGAVAMAGIAAPLTLLTGSVLAWHLAERLLRPVRRMTETARSIGESDLSQRLGIDEEDEARRAHPHVRPEASPDADDSPDVNGSPDADGSPDDD